METDDPYFRPSLEALARVEAPTDLIVSGYLRKSRTFAVYGRAMPALGIPGTYRPYELPRRDGGPDLDGLAAFLRVFAANPALRSLVVSDPYKLAVAGLVDRPDASAAQVGAVNLVVKEVGATVGYTIDGDAFVLGAAGERGL